MSCPVVNTIKELYGGYEYGTTNHTTDRVNETSMLIPSGISGGGTTSTDISMEAAKFYITMRKLQFARAELTVQQHSSQHSSQQTQHSIIGDSLENTEHSEHTTNSVYFKRMFKDYYGKTSAQILSRILGTNKMYTVITRAVDLIDIMEGICISTLARDFPSGMSIPTVYFDPNAIENINAPDNIHSEINKIIQYANKICVGELRTKIEPIPKFHMTLRDFTFPVPDHTTSDQPTSDHTTPSKLLELDMEVATYAHALEQYQCTAIKKLNEIMNLCQSIIDLGSQTD